MSIKAKQTGLVLTAAQKLRHATAGKQAMKQRASSILRFSKLPCSLGPAQAAHPHQTLALIPPPACHEADRDTPSRIVPLSHLPLHMPSYTCSSHVSTAQPTTPLSEMQDIIPNCHHSPPRSQPSSSYYRLPKEMTAFPSPTDLAKDPAPPARAEPVLLPLMAIIRQGDRLANHGLPCVPTEHRNL